MFTMLFFTSQTTKAAPKQTTTGTFGGMKKGFLFGSSSKPKSGKKTTNAKPSAGATDIPFIKPKAAEGQGERQHEIAEVQEAMKASAPLLQNTGRKQLVGAYSCIHTLLSQEGIKKKGN